MRVYTPQNPCGCIGYLPRNLTARLGLYEYTPALGGSPSLAIDHYFVSWVGPASAILQQDFVQSSSRGHMPLVTIEPYNSSGLSSQTLLTDISAGKYDANIISVCGAFATYNAPLSVRWGHEMENVTGRYPWASTDSAAFIGAFRYFVSHCRAIAPMASFVWSPAGNKELAAYWPGAAYVDYVGLSMYSYPTWDMTYYGHVRSFLEAFGERYGLVSGYGKPVIIAELGATGAGRDDWLRAAMSELQDFPLVSQAVLFSAQDPADWGPGFPAPNWTLPGYALDFVPPLGIII